MQYIFLQFLIPFSCVFIRLDSSSQAIFGHRRPALEARSICHVECCAVETSLDVSRRGEEAQEPRVSRHAMLRALLFLWLPAQVRPLEDRNQRASISFSSTCSTLTWYKRNWTTFRFPKEFAHCIKFFLMILSILLSCPPSNMFLWNTKIFVTLCWMFHRIFCFVIWAFRCRKVSLCRAGGPPDFYAAH